MSPSLWGGISFCHFQGEAAVQVLLGVTILQSLDLAMALAFKGLHPPCSALQTHIVVQVLGW